MPGYATLEEAVYYAADTARAVYRDRHEAISVVYEQDGRFFFTPPRSQGQRSGSNAQQKVEIPKGSARYIVHNHPGGKGEDVFSQDDIEMAEQLRVPSAIIFGREQAKIRVFRPGHSIVTAVQDRGTRRAQRTSLGDPFDWKPPPAGQGTP
jgi:hypothetical protein